MNRKKGGVVTCPKQEHVRSIMAGFKVLRALFSWVGVSLREQNIGLQLSTLATAPAGFLCTRHH